MTTERNYKIDDADLSEFIAGYLGAALGTTSADDIYGREYLLEEKFGSDDLTDVARDEMHKQARKFLEYKMQGDPYSGSHLGQLIGSSQYQGKRNPWSQAGFDFWMDRNDARWYGVGQPAVLGFGDGDWVPEQVAIALTDAAKAMGPAEIYVNDDGGLEWYPEDLLEEPK